MYCNNRQTQTDPQDFRPSPLSMLSKQFWYLELSCPCLRPRTTLCGAPAAAPACRRHGKKLSPISARNPHSQSQSILVIAIGSQSQSPRLAMNPYTFWAMFPGFIIFENNFSRKLPKINYYPYCLEELQSVRHSRTPNNSTMNSTYKTSCASFSDSWVHRGFALPRNLFGTWKNWRDLVFKSSMWSSFTETRTMHLSVVKRKMMKRLADGTTADRIILGQLFFHVYKCGKLFHVYKFQSLINENWIWNYFISIKMINEK